MTWSADAGSLLDSRTLLHPAIRPLLTASVAPVIAPLAANLDRVRRRIAEVCAANSREPSSVELVAVTKSVDAATAGELARLGANELAENHVQELERKATELAKLDLRPRWHLIGHLQSNKARRAVALADVIHSVDSLRLVERLNQLAGETGRKPEIYLEVKCVASAERSGFEPSAVAAAVEFARTLEHVSLVGLMTMAPTPDDTSSDETHRAAARAVFRRVAELARSLPKEAFAGGHVRLSMGMSQDFAEAIAEGATSVRIGSALFENCAAPERG